MISGDPDYIRENTRRNFERLEAELRAARVEIAELAPRAILWDALEAAVLEHAATIPTGDVLAAIRAAVGVIHRYR